MMDYNKLADSIIVSVDAGMNSFGVAEMIASAVDSDRMNNTITVDTAVIISDPTVDDQFSNAANSSQSVVIGNKSFELFC